MPEIDTSNRFDRMAGTIAAPAPTSVICTSTPRMTPSAVARSASMPTRPPSAPWKLIGGVRSVATFSTPADLTDAGSLAASVSFRTTPGSAVISALGVMTSAVPWATATVPASATAASTSDDPRSFRMPSMLTSFPWPQAIPASGPSCVSF